MVYFGTERWSPVKVLYTVIGRGSITSMVRQPARDDAQQRWVSKWLLWIGIGSPTPTSHPSSVDRSQRASTGPYQPRKPALTSPVARSSVYIPDWVPFRCVGRPNAARPTWLAIGVHRRCATSRHFDTIRNDIRLHTNRITRCRVSLGLLYSRGSR